MKQQFQVPPDGLITLSEGENASLSCFVSGADVSDENQLLRWTREGVAFQVSLLAKHYNIIAR